MFSGSPAYYVNLALKCLRIRWKSWSIEAHHTKTLVTSLGEVTFKKTLFLNKQTKQRSYLLDQVLGLEPKQRLTEDAFARMLEEAVQTSYQRGGQQASLCTQVSRQTVKNKIHALEFPKASHTPEEKKNVDWLYIDADEDHVALQFQKNKGDLTKAENGVKNNGLITKMVCVYEGKEEETMYSKRRVLTNRHFFCGVNSGEANLKFWDDIYGYLERNYDLGKVKRIYLNADGGSWIKAGAKRLKGVTYVLDGFHLEKYLAKLVPHLKRKERIPVLEEFRKTIRNQTKDDFRELVEKQKKEYAGACEVPEECGDRRREKRGKNPEQYGDPEIGKEPAWGTGEISGENQPQPVPAG